MGASLQAPHATPRQRQMETSSWVDPSGLYNNNNDNDDFGSKSNKIRFRSRNCVGGSFQAPCAAPGQGQMETHHDLLIIVLYFSVPL